MNTFNIIDIVIDDGSIIKGAAGYGPNYTFTGASKEINGHRVWQIVALVDVYDVVPGEFGGWVEENELLSQTERCWIKEDVIAYGKTSIRGDSLVSGNTVIEDSVIESSYINENSTYDLSIKSSNISYCEISAQGKIKNSSLNDGEMRSYASILHDIVVEDTKFDRVFIGSTGELAIKGCSISDMEFEFSDTLVNMCMQGSLMQNTRPYVFYNEEGCKERVAIGEEYFNKKYDGYIQIEEYTLESFKRALDSMTKYPYSGDSKSSSTSTSFRTDVADFLNNI